MTIDYLTLRERGSMILRTACAWYVAHAYPVLAVAALVVAAILVLRWS